MTDIDETIAQFGHKMLPGVKEQLSKIKYDPKVITKEDFDEQEQDKDQRYK